MHLAFAKTLPIHTLNDKNNPEQAAERYTIAKQAPHDIVDVWHYAWTPDCLQVC